MDPRKRVSFSFLLDEAGQLLPDMNKNSSIDSVAVVEAATPLVELAHKWLHPSGLITVEYIKGNVPPGFALMPPPHWHVDDPHNDTNRIAFASNIDPTMSASGSLSGSDRRAYLKAKKEAAADSNGPQIALRNIVDRAIEEYKLEEKPVGEYELVGMDNRHVHRPQINKRKTPILREAVRIYSRPHNKT